MWEKLKTQYDLGRRTTTTNKTSNRTHERVPERIEKLKS